MLNNRPTLPPAPGPGRLLCVAAAATAGVLGDVDAVRLAIIDSPTDGTPDALIDVVALISSSALVIATILAVGYELSRRTARNGEFFELALRDLQTDTGSIPVLSDKVMEIPLASEAMGAVTEIAGEVHNLADDVRDLGARVEQIGERQRWLVADRKALLARLTEAETRQLPTVDTPPQPTVEQVEEMPPVDLKEIAKRAFDTGRRVGRREAGEETG